MKKYSIALLLCLQGILGFGQETATVEMQNFAPKSPEAAAFLKYGEYPVDLSTGVPNISIPIYTVQAGSYSLPISLNYHASGIKVNQESTWVGLGWNLNSGAQIVLSPRDNTDENNPYIDEIPDADAIYSYWNNHPYQFNGGMFTTHHLNESRVKDVYSFSSATANGNFYIRNFASNDVVIFPPDAFKVELLGTSRQNMFFKITDPAGNVYSFTTTKETAVGALDHGNSYANAWYVDEIQTPNKDKITFVYQDDNTITDISKSQRIDVTENCINCGPTCDGRINNTISAVISANNTTITTVKKIKEIVFNEGNSKVVFTKTEGRQDLINSGSYLDKIEIRQLKNSVFELVKGFDLDYSYFDSGVGTIGYERKRLKLDRVISLLEGEGHEFVYSNITLPGKTSKAQDYYGYYNGASNLDLIPKHFIRYNNVEVGTANRTVAPTVNQAGMLTEIHYPTKGWTKFNYETNQYYGVDDLDKYNLKIVSSNTLQGTGLGSMDPATITQPGLDNIPMCTAPNPNNCVQYREVPFEAVNAKGQLKFDVVFDNSVTIHYQYARVRILNAGNEVYDSAKISSNQTVTYNFDNLTYSGVILMEVYSSNFKIEGFSIRYTNNDTAPKNLYGGGLRIRNVENYNHDAALALKKEYDYTDVTDAAKSSGKLINNLVTSFITNAFTNFNLHDCNGSYPSLDYQKTYSVASSSRYGIEGNSVVYKYVKERSVNAIDGSKNGYTQYEFTTDSDEIPLGNPTVQIFTSWKRGKTVEKKDYKSVGGTDYLLRKEKNEYYEDHSKTSQIQGFKMFKIMNINENEDPNNPFQTPWTLDRLAPNYGLPTSVDDTAELVTYNLPVYWFYLKSTEVTDYFYDASNASAGSVFSKTNYFYDNPVHLQLTRTETTNSEGEVQKSVNYYPDDLPVVAQMTALKAQNRVGEIIKTERFNSGVSMSVQNKTYKDWGNGIIAQEIIQTSVEGNPLENRVRYTVMDNTNGKPLELKMENGIPVTYIWGYKKSQPIAKIENATYASIPSATVTNLQALSDTGTEANLIAALNDLRTSLPNAMVSTYTYLPLVGVSTITDPKGDKITYTYDAQGRLVEVKDKDGNILKTNEYHYKN